MTLCFCKKKICLPFRIYFRIFGENNEPQTSIWCKLSLTDMVQIIANITSGSGLVLNSYDIQHLKRRDDLGPNQMGLKQSNNGFCSIRGAWGEFEKFIR
jgi:hypothetical protein